MTLPQGLAAVSPAPPASAPEEASVPLLEVVGGGLPVPLVTGGSVPYANLDYAASAPALGSVADRLAEVLPYYSSVHRGAGYPSVVSTALYERSRVMLADFLRARADDVVIFTRNTTDALNLLARCVPTGGEVLYLDIEHHANLLPWRASGRCLTAADTMTETLRRLTGALEERPAALVALTGASNVTGEVLPVAEVVALAHARGARVALDAAQLAPHRRVDLTASGVDYLALSGHKLYAPFGAGVLVGRRDWLDVAPPLLAGGGAVRSVSVGHTDWAPAPARHEAGTPNVFGAAALAAACEAVAALPDGALARHEEALRSQLVAGLGDLRREGIPGARVHRLFADGTDHVGVVTFTLPGHDPGRLAAYLSAEHGVGVRDGRFCAHPLLARLGLGDGALRASVGVGSCRDDVDRLLVGLETWLARGPRWDYAQLEGRWVPVPDPRPVPKWSGFGLAGGGASPCVAKR